MKLESGERVSAVNESEFIIYRKILMNGERKKSICMYTQMSGMNGIKYYAPVCPRSGPPATEKIIAIDDYREVRRERNKCGRILHNRQANG